jgi:nucleoside diphosphate kinase
LFQASEDLLKQHYADLAARPFYPGLCKYMASGPVVPMVWEGLNVVKTGRVMLGETNPQDSKPGTIRGDFSIQVQTYHLFPNYYTKAILHRLSIYTSMKHSLLLNQAFTTLVIHSLDTLSDVRIKSIYVSLLIKMLSITNPSLAC